MTGSPSRPPKTTVPTTQYEIGYLTPASGGNRNKQENYTDTKGHYRHRRDTSNRPGISNDAGLDLLMSAQYVSRWISGYSRAIYGPIYGELLSRLLPIARMAPLALPHVCSCYRAQANPKIVRPFALPLTNAIRARPHCFADGVHPERFDLPRSLDGARARTHDRARHRRRLGKLPFKSSTDRSTRANRAILGAGGRQRASIQ